MKKMNKKAIKLIEGIGFLFQYIIILGIAIAVTIPIFGLVGIYAMLKKQHIDWLEQQNERFLAGVVFVHTTAGSLIWYLILR